jgi:hypothetical protein
MPYRVEILSEGNNLGGFLEVPYKIFKDDPYWVAPLQSEVRRTLDQKNNPYFINASLQKFVCYNNGNPVARSIAVINREHWMKFGKRAAFFGFFESANDKEAVVRLFEAISKYCRDEGAELLEGPFNPNHYSELGILTDNFHSAPAFFETYNPDYYLELLESIGFKVSKRLHARINANAGSYLRNRYGDTSFPNGIKDFRVRCISLWNLKSDLERIREVNNDAFEDNWHFLPLTKSEYLYSAKYLFFVTNPGLIVLIEKGKEPVGIIQFMLNINNILQSMHGKASYSDYLRFMWKRRSIPWIILYAAGIKKAYQNTLVAWLMLKATCSIAQRYPVISTTWMSEDNIPSIKTSEHLGLVPYKWFSVYEKLI